jgi:hypothetical protein
MTNLKEEIKKKIIEHLDESAGMKILTKTLSFNDFDGHNGDEDYQAVKKIKWPYGIEVKFDDKNKTVTFKTAKMKTVALMLDKVVDFGSISVGEALDLTGDLLGAYEQDKSRKKSRYLSKWA